MSAVEELSVLNKEFNQLAGKEYDPEALDWEERSHAWEERFDAWQKRMQAWRTKYGIKET